MRLVKATDADNEKLLHYFAQGVNPGSVYVRLRRMFNFFNQYRIQSPDHVTYLLLNDNDEIEAMATLVFREGWIDGEKQIIGYATDLRVSNTRRAILQWSQHFMPVLEEARAQRGCRYIFTVVAQSQRQAYNAFVRPRTIRRNLPRYYLFRRFQTISLHGLWPLHRDPLPGIIVRNATENDFDLLADYLVERNKEKPLFFYGDRAGFRASLERWRDLYIENFLLAFSKQGELLGTAAPWSPQQIQRVYAHKYGPTAQNMRDVLKVLSWFGIAHPLPKEGQELQLRYLTHLNASNPDVLYSLCYNAFQALGKREFLMYSHFEGDLVTLPPKGFISGSQNFGLYCVLSPADKLPDFLKPSHVTQAPDFEPALM